MTGEKEYIQKHDINHSFLPCLKSGTAVIFYACISKTYRD